MNIERGKDFALAQQMVININSYQWGINHKLSLMSYLMGEGNEVKVRKVWMWSNISVFDSWHNICEAWLGGGMQQVG